MVGDSDNNKSVQLWLRLRDAQGKTRDERIGPECTQAVVGRRLPGEQVVDLTIEDKLVSIRHCELFWNTSSDGWWIKDLKSTNGTRLNGVLLKEVSPLSSGDTLLLGRTLIAVQIGDGFQDDDPANKTMVFNRAPQPSYSQGIDCELDKTQLINAYQTHVLRGEAEKKIDSADETLLFTQAPVFKSALADVALDATQLVQANIHRGSLNDETLISLPEKNDATMVANPRRNEVKETSVVKAGADAELQVTLIYSTGTAEVLSGEPGKREYLIGRDFKTKGSQSDFLVADEHASRRHCLIYWRENTGWMVEDLGSANGTQLNGEDLIHSMPVRTGSELLIGRTRLQLKFITPTIATIDDTQTSFHPFLLLDHDKGTIKKTTNENNVELTLVTDTNAATVVMNEKNNFTAPAGDTLVVDNKNSGSDEATVVVAVDENTEDAHAINDTINTINSFLESRAQSKRIENDIINHHAIFQFLSGFAKELIDANFISREQAISLAVRAQISGQTFFRVLAQDASLKFRMDIFKMVAKKFSVPLIETEKELVNQLKRPEPSWLSAMRAHRFGALALLDSDDGGERVATIDPFDLITRDRVERLAGYPLQWILVHPDAFFQVTRRLKNSQEAFGESDENVSIIDIAATEENEIRDNIAGVDVPKMVDYFLHRASSQGASDIHIEPAEDFLGVRNRIDGILHDEINLPKNLHSEVVSRIKIISGMDVAEKRRPQDGRFGRIIKENPIDVRVSTFPTVYGEKIVFRLLDKNALRPSPESLGLLARDLRLLRDKLMAPYGLIMISGPTGSGKTTTLYSCLSAIDKTRKNVLTVEDPVEYRLGGVHQMQVNHRINLTFASGLRTMLRQDPDVIMVGECRDAETANMAIQASLTGHVVFSTIHTNDAVGVVPRLLDMKIENFLVATALTLAIAQRLVRKICPHCKTAVMGNHILKELNEEGISDERLQQLGIKIDPEMEYAQGRGINCEYCRETGYLGRQAVFEVFEMTNEARRIIMSPIFSADDLRKHVLERGMTTLIRHGLTLVEDEVTTFQEVIRVLGEMM
ncbi:hypothetical protein CCP3SC5AM1_80024 [Gammaproteobacteria bacterium]